MLFYSEGKYLSEQVAIVVGYVYLVIIPRHEQANHINSTSYIRFILPIP